LKFYEKKLKKKERNSKTIPPFHTRGMQTCVPQHVQADFRAEFDFDFVPFSPRNQSKSGFVLTPPHDLEFA
jgi:hypothetical protein